MARDRIADAVNAVDREVWTTALADRVAAELARRMESEVIPELRVRARMALADEDPVRSRLTTAFADSDTE
jgi:hypothetical protein